MTNKAALKAITEDAVIREVKAVIELTGLAIQLLQSVPVKPAALSAQQIKEHSILKVTITAGGSSVSSASVRLAGVYRQSKNTELTT